MKIEYGFCNCGCGNKTNIARQNFNKLGVKKGESFKFLRGHCSRLDNKLYVDGIMHMHGYRYIFTKNHPRTESHGYVPEHVLVIEKAIGKYLPKGSIPHHVNGERSDNRKVNLVLCQDYAYHNFIHARIRAFKACGYANWRKCNFCKKYDRPENLYIGPANHRGHAGSSWHKSCRYDYDHKK